MQKGLVVPASVSPVDRQHEEVHKSEWRATVTFFMMFISLFALTIHEQSKWALPTCTQKLHQRLLMCFKSSQEESPLSLCWQILSWSCVTKMSGRYCRNWKSVVCFHDPNIIYYCNTPPCNSLINSTCHPIQPYLSTDQNYTPSFSAKINAFIQGKRKHVVTMQIKARTQAHATVYSGIHNKDLPRN